MLRLLLTLVLVLAFLIVVVVLLLLAVVAVVLFFRILLGLSTIPFVSYTLGTVYRIKANPILTYSLN